MGRTLSVLGSLALLGCAAGLPQPPPERGWDEQATRAASELGRLRGLEPHTAVSIGQKDPEGLEQSLFELFDEEWTENDDLLARAYKLFGLIPPDMDVKSYLVKLYTEQIAGYYDPKAGELFVIEGGALVTPAIQEYVLVHELVHALQDQHFGLQALQDAHERESDRSLALTALIEGDATLAAFDHQLWRQRGPAVTLSGARGRLLIGLITRFGGRAALAGDGPEARSLRDAPDVIRSEILFAYLQGMAFVSAIQSEFGWAAVDEVFRDPPESTEQILYPERYVDHRERPARITLPEDPEGFTRVFEATLGMLDTGVLLREYAGSRARRVSESWDGDLYRVWETEHGEILGWVSVWNTGGAARRFERTYRGVLRRRLGADGAWSTRRVGSRVVTVQGGTRELAHATAERLLRSRVDGHSPRTFTDRILRLLLWPVSHKRWDRVQETRVLGGHLFALRRHGKGHRLSLVRGLVARSEVNPDRRELSVLLALASLTSDRRQDYRAGWILGLFDFHARRVGDAQHSEWALLRLPLIGPLLGLRGGLGEHQLDLLGGLALRLRWGSSTATGGRVRILLLPVPGL